MKNTATRTPSAKIIAAQIELERLDATFDKLAEPSLVIDGILTDFVQGKIQLAEAISASLANSDSAARNSAVVPLRRAIKQAVRELVESCRPEILEDLEEQAAAAQAAAEALGAAERAGHAKLGIHDKFQPSQSLNFLTDRSTAATSILNGVKNGGPANRGMLMQLF
jgi:hypothetical protein